ncbi:hypothetical protein CE195_06795 [Sodalis-like symbiont of Philaenus spumarius]|nr:hypothetical protein CE195_06795 [Sodalis-like symbiont of Philaenus spumarius]
MITVSVHCPRCHSDEIYRHGLRSTKRSRLVRLGPVDKFHLNGSEDNAQKLRKHSFVKDGR